MSKGIYTITNKKTGKVYVGAIYTNTFKLRWINHASDLNCNHHVNKALQADWNRYGERAFEFSELEAIDTDDLHEVSHREQYWIDYFKGQGEIYNRVRSWVPRVGYPRGELTTPKTITALPVALAYLDTIDEQEETGDTDQQIIDALIREAQSLGSQTALAAKLGISLAYLNDIIKAKRAPGAKVLQHLGLEKQVIYVKVKK